MKKRTIVPPIAFVLTMTLLSTGVLAQKVSAKKTWSLGRAFNDEGHYRSAASLLAPRATEESKVRPQIKLELARAYSNILLLDSALLNLDNEVTGFKKTAAAATALKADVASAVETYHRLTAEADTLMSEGWYKDAWSRLDEALAIDTGNYEAWFYSAILKEHEEDPVNAEKLYGKALNKYFPENDDKVEVWNAFAFLALSMRQYHIAITRYKKALEIDPDNGEALYGLGYSYFMSRKFEEAVIAMETYLADYPDDANAWDIKGRALYLMGKYNQAVSDLTEALKYDRSLIEAIDYKGRSFYYLNAFDSAAYYFEYLNNLYSGNFYAMNALGNIAFAKMQFEKAFEWYEKAFRLYEYDRVAYNAALTSFVMGHYKQAMKYIEKAIVLNPDVPLYSMAKARIMLKRGYPEQALKFIDEQIRKNKIIAGYYLVRAEIHEAMNRPKQAQVDRDIAHKLNGKPIDWKPLF